MNERVEQMFWIFWEEHKEGEKTSGQLSADTKSLVVALSPDATSRISSSLLRAGTVAQLESERLAVIHNDSIFKLRCRNNYYSQEYMKLVDPQWREELYQEAEKVSEKIVTEAAKIGKRKIAVILFGSVAKNLSRSRNYIQDPSNIDLTVVGDFKEDERIELLNLIRNIRDESGKQIGANVGVHVQCPEVLRKDGYYQSLIYIGSSARALHDPEGIWKEIETEALIFSHSRRSWESIRSQINKERKLIKGEDLIRTRSGISLRNLYREKVIADVFALIEEQDSQPGDLSLQSSKSGDVLKDRIIEEVFLKGSNRNDMVLRKRLGKSVHNLIGDLTFSNERVNSFDRVEDLVLQA